MQQPIPFHTVQELEQYLQTQYGAGRHRAGQITCSTTPGQQPAQPLYPRWWGSLAALVRLYAGRSKR